MGGLGRNSLGQFATTHGLSNTPTYYSWTSMHSRCSNVSMENYSRYGAKGVTVCERWQSFDAFLADMGERPDGATLERKDSTKDYEPGNCTWATPKQQARNRRSTVLSEALVAKGKRLREGGLGFTEIGRRLGVGRTTIRAAIVGTTWL